MAYRGVTRNTSYIRRTWRLDAGDVVEGVGVGGLATVSRLCGAFWEEGGVVVDRDYARVCGG